jgi:hypothetical protein
MSMLDKAESLAETVIHGGNHDAASKNMSSEAFSSSKDQLTFPKPGNACIRDPHGFIDCGPIVGYPRPDSPVQGPSIDDPIVNPPGNIEATPKDFIEIPDVPKFPSAGPGQPSLEFFHYDPETEKLIHDKPPPQFPKLKLMDNTKWKN